MDAQPGPGQDYKVVVLGSGGVGKSALTIRFVTDNFLDDYDPTIEDSYRKQINVDDECARLDILDTAGQEEYSSMQDQWIRDGKGFLLVYAINQRSSFEEINMIRDKILRSKDTDNVPIVLVGNKCDLADERQVTQDEAKELANSWKCQFIEASAREKINSDEIFLQVVREIRTSERPKGDRKGGRGKFFGKFNQKCVLL